jgi:hypothetical protein
MKRPREYLTEREIERLMDAARQNRWGHRDATAIWGSYSGWSEGYRLYLSLTSCGLYRSHGSNGSPVSGLPRSDLRDCC